MSAEVGVEMSLKGWPAHGFVMVDMECGLSAGCGVEQKNEKAPKKKKCKQSMNLRHRNAYGVRASSFICALGSAQPGPQSHIDGSPIIAVPSVFVVRSPSIRVVDRPIIVL